MSNCLLLGQEFFARKSPTVARELLGKWLFSRIGRRLTGGVIVETEAYLPEGDSASHAARGKTAGNAAMFGRPGLAYVYPIHSRCCFNVVTEAEGIGAAVLIRAIAPELGLEWMRRRRSARRATVPPDHELCSGPAKLCEALGIERDRDQHDLTLGRGLWLGELPGVMLTPEIRLTPRIGVTSAGHLPLRFVWAGHRSASGPSGWR